jgi:hypothetical protein
VDLYIHCPIHLHGVELNELNTGTTLGQLLMDRSTYLQNQYYVEPLHVALCWCSVTTISQGTTMIFLYTEKYNAAFVEVIFI